MSDHNDLQKMCTGPELQVGELYGLRAFWADDFGRLLPVTYKNQSSPRPWTPGENVAECKRSTSGYSIGGLTYATLTAASISAPGQVVLPPAEEIKFPPKPEHGPVPRAKCTCGFYAYFDPGVTHGDMSLFFDTSITHPWFLGVVAAYGKCLVGGKGFRAERARIVALAADMGRRVARSEKDLIALVKSNYDVPVYRTREQLLKRHPLTEKPRTPDSDERFWDVI